MAGKALGAKKQILISFAKRDFNQWPRLYQGRGNVHSHTPDPKGSVDTSRKFIIESNPIDVCLNAPFFDGPGAAIAARAEVKLDMPAKDTNS